MQIVMKIQCFGFENISVKKQSFYQNNVHCRNQLATFSEDKNS